MNLFQKTKSRLEGIMTRPAQELSLPAQIIRFPIQLWQFYFRRMQSNNSMAMSAALSFQTIFALVPTLVLTLLILKSYLTPQESEQFIRNGLKALNLTEIKIVQSEDLGVTTEAGLLDPCALAHENGRLVLDPCMVEQGDIDPVRDPCAFYQEKNGSTAVTEDGPPQQNVKEVASLADEIVKLVKNVEKKLSLKLIGPIGFLLLIWTAIRLMVTIEQSLNRIYGARLSRGWVKRAMLYWAVLSLVPILWIVANYIGNETMRSLPPQSQTWAYILNIAGRIGPLFISIISLAAVYKLMPNTRVSFMAAIGGALVAVPLWLLAKWGFQLYVNHVGKNSLYGAMALIPIFLIWLNWSWRIFLFGAELSHTAANLKRMRAEELAAQIHLGPNDRLAVVLAIAQRYQKAEGPTPFDEIAEKLNLPDESVDRLLNRLVDHKILCPVENGQENTLYTLARPVEKIRLLEVLEIDSPQTAIETMKDGEIARTLNLVNLETQDKLGDYTLADALAKP